MRLHSLRAGKSCTDRRVEDNVIAGALWTEHRGKLPKILHCNGSGQNRGHNDKPHSRMDRVRNYNLSVISGGYVNLENMATDSESQPIDTWQKEGTLFYFDACWVH